MRCLLRASSRATRVRSVPSAHLPRRIPIALCRQEASGENESLRHHPSNSRRRSCAETAQTMERGTGSPFRNSKRVYSCQSSIRACRRCLRSRETLRRLFGSRLWLQASKGWRLPHPSQRRAACFVAMRWRITAFAIRGVPGCLPYRRQLPTHRGSEWSNSCR